MAEIITAQLERLHSDFSLHPVTATEIEFYLIGAAACPSLPGFWRDVTAACERESIALYKTDKETGREQYEAALTPLSDPVRTASDTAALRAIITQAASTHGMAADFAAKPFSERPGSGLHLHVHLADRQGKNIFYKDDATISAALQYAIGGLMTWLNPCMAVFAPQVESYARFQPGSNGPLTVSWGANNRTVAIRLPDTGPTDKRIEHRVAGADADPGLVMAVVLAGIHYGLSHECDPGRQVHGDASLPMYGLPRIIASLDEAVERLHKTSLFEGYFSVSELLPAH